MAGHSKWKTIKRTKEAEDAKRSALFTRFSKEILTAVKLGESGDVDFNPMLKVAIDKAKAGNMPNDKIEKAVNRGLGVRDPNEIILENTYEFYGPEGTAFIVDTETDNANRTVSDLKTIATKNGGKMASEGSISWQFEEFGIIMLAINENTQDEVDEFTLEILEVEGILDIKEIEKEGQKLIRIKTNRENLKNVVDEVKESKFDLVDAGLQKITENLTEVSNPEKVKKFEEALEEVSSVVNIWKNF